MWRRCWGLFKLNKNKWQTVSLSEIADYKTGKLNSNAAVENGKYPFFTCSRDTFKTNTWSFDCECVLLAGNNANAEYPVKYFEGKFDAYQRTYVITTKDPKILSVRFLYFVIELKLNLLKSLSTGAATRFLTKGIIDNLQIDLPSIEEQEEIVKILGSYDDIIENNTRRIAILETMAQNLYREWFVNFRFPGYQQREWQGIPQGKVPQDWDTVELGKLITVRRGKTITRKTAIPEDVPVVAGGLQPAYFHSVANTTSPVITVSASGANAGYVNMYTIPVWASDCSYIDTETTPYVYYYYLLMKDRQVEITRMQTGAAQPHVYPKDLMRLEVFDVPTGLLDDFTERVTPVFRLMANLVTKNNNLQQQRDLFLPKLVKF